MERSPALASARNVGKATHLAPVLVDYGRWLDRIDALLPASARV